MYYFHVQEFLLYCNIYSTPVLWNVLSANYQNSIASQYTEEHDVQRGQCCKIIVSKLYCIAFFHDQEAGFEPGPSFSSCLLNCFSLNELAA